MLYTSLSCENLPGICEFDTRGGVPGGVPAAPVHHQAYFYEWPVVNQRRVMYKQKKPKGIFKRKKNGDHYGGFFERYPSQVETGPTKIGHTE